MSQTARGLQPGGAGMTSNPLLPRVNMGANIRTPGDAMYQGGGAPAQYQQVQYQGPVNPGLPAAHMGANIGTAGDNMRSDLRRPPAPQPRRYNPPQNQQQQSTGILYKPSSGGVATYAESTATSGGSRHF